jgi:NAD(P)H dehydrogenase (quinone)
MTSVTVLYHSGYGHTARLAQAVHRGVQSVPGTTAHLISVDEVAQHWDTLDRSEAILFGCPTYMGGPSAQFKAFADSTGARWMSLAWKDKLAAGFTNSGSPAGDKLGTLVQLSIFAAQHGMNWITLGLNPSATTNRLGSFLGATSQSPHGAADDVAPPADDLATGELLGRRVAEAAQRWARGHVRAPATARV